MTKNFKNKNSDKKYKKKVKISKKKWQIFKKKSDKYSKIKKVLTLKKVTKHQLKHWNQYNKVTKLFIKYNLTFALNQHFLGIIPIKRKKKVIH